VIDTILFDMDGVLIDAREWHYAALNRALALFGYSISRADHLTTFDGLSTRQKLDLLSITDELPRGLHPFLNALKQTYTMEIIHAQCKPVFDQEFALSKLRAEGFRLAVASNSVRATVETMMAKSGLSQYVETMVSNEDVTTPKPDPEIYFAAMERMRAEPESTLIVEDNENGIRAAHASGANVMAVRSPKDVNYSNIRAFIDRIGVSA
jgi:beta-phosphoglucomutase